MGVSRLCFERRYFIFCSVTATAERVYLALRAAGVRRECVARAARARAPLHRRAGRPAPHFPRAREKVPSAPTAGSLRFPRGFPSKASHIC